MYVKHINHEPIIEEKRLHEIDWQYWYSRCEIVMIDTPPGCKRIIYIHLIENDAICGLVYAETIGLDGVE